MLLGAMFLFPVLLRIASDMKVHDLLCGPAACVAQLRFFVG